MKTGWAMHRESSNHTSCTPPPSPFSHPTSSHHLHLPSVPSPCSLPLTFNIIFTASCVLCPAPHIQHLDTIFTSSCVLPLTSNISTPSLLHPVPCPSHPTSQHHLYCLLWPPPHSQCLDTILTAFCALPLTSNVSYILTPSIIASCAHFSAFLCPPDALVLPKQWLLFSSHSGYQLYDTEDAHLL